MGCITCELHDDRQYTVQTKQQSWHVALQTGSGQTVVLAKSAKCVCLLTLLFSLS
jgi:hypothetical protein